MQQEPFIVTLQRASKLQREAAQERRARDARLGKGPAGNNVVRLPDQTKSPVQAPVQVPINAREEEEEKKEARAKLLLELEAEFDALRKRFDAIVAEDDTPIVSAPVKPIIRLVAAYYKVPMNIMLSWRRSQDVARPRQVAMYLARELTTRSLTAIGRVMARDHSTVPNNVRRIERLRKIDADLDRQLCELTGLIKAQVQ